MSELTEGMPAPGFTMDDGAGARVSLDDFKGKSNVVLYFYPKDDTPGCTKEACSFRDEYDLYTGLDTQVLGVSRDSSESHSKFSEKYNLPFPLLADTDGRVCEAYGVWQEKNNYGKKSMGIVRSTFVIDKQGIIRKIFRKVSVDGHSEAVRGVLKTVQA